VRLNRALAYGHFVLGVLAYDQLEWATSELELRASLELWQQLDDPYMEAMGLSNLGPPLRKQKKYEDAIACYQTALERFEDLNDELVQGRLYMGLGNIYSDMNQLPQALEMFRKAEPIIRQFKNPISLANCWSVIGNVYREMEKWQKAEEILQQAIEQFIHYERIELIIDKMFDLALVSYYQDQIQEGDTIKANALNYLNEVEDEEKRKSIYEDQTAYLEQKIADWKQKKM